MSENAAIAIVAAFVLGLYLGSLSEGRKIPGAIFFVPGLAGVILGAILRASGVDIPTVGP